MTVPGPATWPTRSHSARAGSGTPPEPPCVCCGLTAPDFINGGTCIRGHRHCVLCVGRGHHEDCVACEDEARQ
jgi:hypothetical protein